MTSSTREQLKGTLATQKTAPPAPRLSAAEMKRPQSVETISGLIDSMKGELARALPRHLTADRLARIAVTVVRNNPGLARCSPISLLGSLMTCAQLGLEPGPLGHAYFVPYGTEAQFQLGYKGMIELALRSGKIVSLIAREVYANDTFEVNYGLEDGLIHKPMILGDRGDVVAWYAVAKFTSGGHAFVVMSRGDVEKYRKRSKQPNSPMWRDDYDAAAKKTCIRRLFTYLPTSVEMAQAIAQDGQVRTEIDVDALDAPPTYDDSTTVEGEVVTEAGPVDANGEILHGDVEPPSDMEEPPAEPDWGPVAQPGQGGRR